MLGGGATFLLCVDVGLALPEPVSAHLLGLHADLALVPSQTPGQLRQGRQHLVRGVRDLRRRVAACLALDLKVYDNSQFFFWLLSRPCFKANNHQVIHIN